MEDMTVRLFYNKFNCQINQYYISEALTIIFYFNTCH